MAKNYWVQNERFVGQYMRAQPAHRKKPNLAVFPGKFAYAARFSNVRPTNDGNSLYHWRLVTDVVKILSILTA